MRMTVEAVEFVLILGVFTQNATADEQSPAGSRKYETCRARIEQYIGKHFHQTVSRIDFVFDHKSVGSGNGPKTTALAYKEESPGYHVFEVFATDFDCDARAHIGTAANCIIYRASRDGC